MEITPYWIRHYGYWGIFSSLLLGIVGVPIPDEWLLTFAGYLVYKETVASLQSNLWPDSFE
jgi:membrane protein DedA with SNARE-associated domain